MPTYLTLVPRGLEHVTMDLLRSQKDGVVEQIQVVGEEQWCSSSSSSADPDSSCGCCCTMSTTPTVIIDRRTTDTTTVMNHTTTSHFVQKIQAMVQAYQAKGNKRRRRDCVNAESCRSIVGTVSMASNRHVSVGYDAITGTTTNTTKDSSELLVPFTTVWSQAGQLQGTVWLQFTTTIPAIIVYQWRFLGPLLALVDCFAPIQLQEDQSLEEVTREIIEFINHNHPDNDTVVQTNSTKNNDYSLHFEAALRLWYEHAKQCWDIPSNCHRLTELANWQQLIDLPIKFRLSCLRTESKVYPYTRRQLLTSIASKDIIPSYLRQHWLVDMTKYDLEVVLLQRPSSLAIGLALRPYQHLQLKSFAAGILPSDAPYPYSCLNASNNNTKQPQPQQLVRLRPSTAQLLLQLARIEPGDVVLDPCGGVGTIAMEASLLQPKGVVGICGDVVLTDPTIRHIALEIYHNASSMMHKSRNQHRTTTTHYYRGVCDRPIAWDATNLPLRSSSVDVIVSDLPFGQLCMSSSQLEQFLPLLLYEMARVLHFGSGRMVLLCGSYVPILESFKRSNDMVGCCDTMHQNQYTESNSTTTTTKTTSLVWQLPCDAVFPCNIGGHLAWVIVIQRGEAVPLSMPGRLERMKKLIGKREHVLSCTKNKSKMKRPQALK